MFRNLVKKIVSKLLGRPLFLDATQLRTILGQNAILASRAGKSHFKNLWDAEVKVFSQWGEDGILDYLCDFLDLSKPRVLELGAGDFSECNSRYLAINRNASVFAVDAREDLELGIVNCGLLWKNEIRSLNTWITPKNINSILNQATDFLKQIDLISIDIDSIDYWIASKIDFTNIQIVVVEYNAIFGGKQAVTIPLSENFSRFNAHYSGLYYGASLLAWVRLFDTFSMQFVGTNRVGNNAFFVKSEKAKNLDIRLPDVSDLSNYVDWRCREGRDLEGKLTYNQLEINKQIIGNLTVENIESGELIKVSEVF